MVCSQGGAIPSVLMALGVHGRRDAGGYPPSAKGSVWVLGGRAGALSADYYRDFDPDPDAPATQPTGQRLRQDQAGRCASNASMSARCRSVRPTSSSPSSSRQRV